MSQGSPAIMSEDQKQEIGGRYFLPRNLEEAARMKNQHEWLKGGAGGLVLAPIDLGRQGMRVLDSATADGYWIQDVKSIFPESTEFRFVIPLFAESEVQPVLRKLIKCMKPGAWIQLVEMDFKTPVSEPLESCQAAQKFHKLTSSVVSDPLASTKLAARLNEEGLTNVTYQTVDMIAGSSHPDAALGERGRRNMSSVMAYFQSVSSAEKMGMTAQEWASLPNEFEDEMSKYKIAVRVYFIWGQKPVA
uniref:Methyltransferase n=1 Tax=Hypocrea virens TaxID=29875 RepID=A9Q1E8_HYPVI|nr:methyltransferase [Trichoderma virens]